MVILHLHANPRSPSQSALQKHLLVQLIGKGSADSGTWASRGRLLQTGLIHIDRRQELYCRQVTGSHLSSLLTKRTTGGIGSSWSWSPLQHHDTPHTPQFRRVENTAYAPRQGRSRTAPPLTHCSRLSNTGRHVNSREEVVRQDSS